MASTDYTLDVTPALNFGVNTTAQEIAVGFWGNSDGIALHNVLARPVGNKLGPKIPELVLVLYQGMFACFTASLVCGAVIRKIKPGPFLVFIFLWSTFAYDPIARWSWNPQGWSAQYGVLDFAGGTVVHISSASSVAAYTLFFKYWAQKSYSKEQIDSLIEEQPPHNITNVVLGTLFLWIGWFGFNGGSALGANLRAVSACVSTHLAACAGGVCGILMEWMWESLEAVQADYQPEGKTPGLYSIISFCNGAVAGLVAITPAAGYVRSWPVILKR
ncbi:hypothetical protein GP486_006233 [Trichoglossum hirsutum]|uniref:Ammonium transporter AmtB-like domain-containing protein n=1 Tax=Trichoglossum hirsutum TaxID=265104 RepID=A0A9P8IE23_9PEZI|nr:hypothetical protein GP486_006233 [Trichoglossum hirsutum]